MTVLLLAGTTEGRRIATAMADERIDGHASIAGVTEDPAPLDLPMRVGGFGGSDGFEAFLDDRKIRAVVDAPHPFAARINFGESFRIAQAMAPPRFTAMFSCTVILPKTCAQNAALWLSTTTAGISPASTICSRSKSSSRSSAARTRRGRLPSIQRVWFSASICSK